MIPPFLLVLVATLAVLGGPGRASAAPRTVTLVYTAELRGNLVPCSCPAKPLGGLARRIGWVDSLRSAASEPVFVVDAGSSDESYGGYPFVPASEREGLRGLIADGDRAIAYDAHVGGGDGAPRLRANEARRVDREGVRVGFVAVDERVEAGPAAAAARDLGKIDLLVLLCSGDLNFATRAAGIVHADIVVVARGANYATPIKRDGVIYLGPGLDGKYVGFARIAPGAPVRVLEARLRPMDASVPSAPAWDERVESVLVGVETRHPGALSRGE